MATPAKTPQQDQIDQAIRVGQVIARMASHCFWRPTCLPQALATSWILRRSNIPVSLQLGVRGSGANFEAHAWVEVFEQIIIGGQTRHEYLVLNPVNEQNKKMSGTL